MRREERAAVASMNAEDFLLRPAGDERSATAAKLWRYGYQTISRRGMGARRY